MLPSSCTDSNVKVENVAAAMAQPRARMSDLMGVSHRLLSSSFLGLPYRIPNINHKKELLRSLWVSHVARENTRL